MIKRELSFGVAQTEEPSLTIQMLAGAACCRPRRRSVSRSCAPPAPPTRQPASRPPRPTPTTQCHSMADTRRHIGVIALPGLFPAVASSMFESSYCEEHSFQAGQGYIVSNDRNRGSPPTRLECCAWSLLPDHPVRFAHAGCRAPSVIPSAARDLCSSIAKDPSLRSE
jgi:hypothetical protein